MQQYLREPGYHSPKATDYDFEYVKTNDLTEQKTNAESGQLQWAIKQECSDWVEYGSTKNDGLNVSPQPIDLDPVTGKRCTLHAFDGNNMIRVGATKYLILRLENTEKVKIYFTGGSSSNAVLTTILTSDDGDRQILNSTLEINKKSTPRSDALELTLDPKKKYSLQIGGTQDIAVYAVNLWPGGSGIVANIDASDENDVVYSLQGIPVSNPGSQKIYIRKGQKYIY